VGLDALETPETRETPETGVAPDRSKTRTLPDAERRLIIGCLLLVGVTMFFYLARWAMTGRGMNFLIWNLFLAAIPVGVALIARHHHSRPWFWGLLLVWLFFFPNAPYIVTDLMHIRTARPANLWLDVLVLGAFAITGLVSGLVSLRWMHEALLRRAFSARVGWAFVALVSLLSGFGVYLGRFQRWNTWDIVTRPTELLAEAWSALTETHVLGFSLLFSLVVLGGYAFMSVMLGPPINAASDTSR
jgi:uncharacterized membrane protein